jgi:fructose-bisphosphate aldolase, class II
MPLVQMRDMLNHAHQHGYAVGSFHLASLDFLEGVLAAAEHCRAPVTFSLGDLSDGNHDLDLLAAATLAAARRTAIPVAISLDHCTDVASAERAIAFGCNAVKIDISLLSFDENLRKTREIATLLHAHEVTVTGTLGYAPPAENVSDGSVGFSFTSPAEAKAYVERSGVDCLAVSIGSMYGRISGQPKLDYARLAKINELANVPLVVHDGTGLSDDQFRRIILNGVAKINYYAGLANAAARVMRNSSRGTQHSDYPALLSEVRKAVRDEAEHYIRLWGGSGRAAEVLEQCRPWMPVDIPAKSMVQALTY